MVLPEPIILEEILIAQCNDWREITLSTCTSAPCKPHFHYAVLSATEPVKKLKDKLRHKGSALAIVQPKQEESLSSLVAVPR